VGAGRGSLVASLRAVAAGPKLASEDGRAGFTSSPALLQKEKGDWICMERCECNNEKLSSMALCDIKKPNLVELVIPARTERLQSLKLHWSGTFGRASPFGEEPRVSVSLFGVDLDF
jgi:hypothetical protein